MPLLAVLLWWAPQAGAQLRVPPPPQPPILGREAWNARRGRPLAGDKEKVRVIVHHSDILVTDDEKSLAGEAALAATIAHARTIQAIHRYTNGWSDIGYHYMVDWRGNVLQGRPVESLGSHTDDHNAGSIGVVLMGDFESQSPTPEQLAGLRSLLSWLTHSRGIDPAKIHGHRTYNATACPGKFLDDPADPDKSPLSLLRRGLVAERKLAGVMNTTLRDLSTIGRTLPLLVPAR